MAGNREIHFSCSLGDDAFFVRRIDGREALNDSFDYRLELYRPSDKPAIKADQLLGKTVTVRLDMPGSARRYFNGHVVRFDKGGVHGRFDLYAMRLRPWSWYLNLGADCRIFQNKTVVEIVKEVFGDYSNAHYSNKLTASYRKRAFCVQYRESDLAFITRLLEDEGIRYHFEHHEQRHELVLSDSGSTVESIGGDGLCWAQRAGDDVVDVVQSWTRSRTVTSLKYATDDYDFTAPTSKLAASVSATDAFENPGRLEVYDYPGEYSDNEQADAARKATPEAQKEEGRRVAESRLHALRGQRDVGRGSSPSRRLLAGRSFSFTEHDDAGDYLLTEITLSGEFGGLESGEQEQNAGYLVDFEVIPKGAAYQPEPSVPRPLVSGPQTAVVVGGEGDEIYTDEYGRVKVKFRWDRKPGKDADSSCWVRVSHPWAGNGYGHIALPRVGEEVVIEFLEGDPDRPLVTGRVYNGQNKSPYPLPKHATVSGMRTRSSVGEKGDSGHFNELRFDDKKGSEYVWLQAERDFHRLVKHDAFDSVNRNAWSEVLKSAYASVGENFTLTVAKVSKLKFDGDVHAKLGADLHAALAGALNVKVTGAAALKVEQAAALSVGEGLDLKAGQALNVEAGARISLKADAGVIIDGGTQLVIKAGASFVVLGPDGVSISGPMVKINSGGSAGAAASAAEASPADPQVPDAPEQNKDPLSSGDGS